MTDAQDRGDAMADTPDEAPDTEELTAPSTEADPGEEPKAATVHDPDPDHEAVGIGVVGGSQIDEDHGV